MKILSIFIAAVITLTPINAAKKTATLAKDSYHQICLDLDSKILKPGKTLTRAEKKSVQNYLNIKTVSKLNKNDLKHFVNAIKKHRFIEIDKKLSKASLKSWPEKHTIGKWYNLSKPTKDNFKKISKKIGNKYKRGNKINSSTGNEDGTNETMDQDNGQVK